MAGLVLGSPLLAALLGDADLEPLLDEAAELSAMVRFEAALAAAAAEHGVIPAAAGEAIEAALAAFAPDGAALVEAAARDGVVVPELVRQLRAAVGAPHARHLHVGATSQDVIDTALVLRLGPMLVHIDRRLEAIGKAFAALDARFGTRSLTGVTRMQPAVKILVGDRLRSWAAPLERHRRRLEALQPELLVVQFGGPAGTLAALGPAAEAVRRSLAARLGLADAPQWHSQRDRIAALGSVLAGIAGSLGKFGQDVALMAQAGDEIALSGGGGSSAMPHKRNPVAAEMLVALARFAAVQVSGLHQALVHEQERSGAAWTLEWLLLPPLLLATGAATRIAGELAGDMTRLGSP